VRKRLVALPSRQAAEHRRASEPSEAAAAKWSASPGSKVSTYLLTCLLMPCALRACGGCENTTNPSMGAQFRPNPLEPGQGNIRRRACGDLVDRIVLCQSLPNSVLRRADIHKGAQGSRGLRAQTGTCSTSIFSVRGGLGPRDHIAPVALGQVARPHRLERHSSRLGVNKERRTACEGRR